jgi:hypothetical protein
MGGRRESEPAWGIERDGLDLGRARLPTPEKPDAQYTISESLIPRFRSNMSASAQPPGRGIRDVLRTRPEE